MKPLSPPHASAIPTRRLLALLAPPASDALAGGFGEDVLSLAEDSREAGPDQESRMPSFWMSALSSSIVRRTKAV